MAKTVTELREERSHLLLSAQDLIDEGEKAGETLEGEKLDKVRDLQARAKEIDAEIAKIEISDTAKEEVRKAVIEMQKPTERKTKPDQPEAEFKEIEPSYKRYSSLKAFKGPDADRDAYRAGKYLRWVLFGDKSAERWVKEYYKRAYAEGTNVTGGFLVPDELARAIINLREEYGVFRRECNVVPMASDSISWPRRLTGQTAYFVGEAASITESTGSFDSFTLTTKKLGVLTRMSREVAEDAVINLADWIANEIAYQFAYKEDLCGFTGDGTSTYGGIRGITTKIIDGTHSAGCIDCATAGHDKIPEVDADDILGLMGALPQYVREPKFFCSKVFKSLVFDALKVAGGGNTVTNLQGVVGDNFLGYPVVVSQVLPASASTDYNNKVMCLFGDLRMAATLGDRSGIDILRSDERYMEYDQVGIRGVERFDINVHDLGDTSNAGPLVALIGYTS
jgi:HK97 family phage major capsid protein